MSPSVSLLRQSCRRLARRPLFTLVAAGSLALGIGGTTAIYSVARSVLLRPMSGIAEPERLVDIGRTRGGGGFDTVGYPDLEDLRQEARTLDRIFAFHLDPYHVRTDGVAERVLGFAVSREYFEALGVRPVHGRFFLPDEESVRGGAAVVVVSHDYFVDQLGGDAARIGSTLHVNGRALTLVGVTPPDFHSHLFALRPRLYVPLSMPLGDDPWQRDRLTSRGSVWMILGGRLAPGVTLTEAQSEVAAIAARVAERFPESHRDRGLRVLPASPLGGEARTPIRLFTLLLFALVGLVLAIACLNVASMLMARAEERRRETAVRKALGAPRRRIVGELLAETSLLFLLAAPPGLLIAGWGVNWIAAFRPPTPFPIFLDFPVDWTAAGFAVALALATGLLFGLAPALHAARHEASADLHGAHATSDRRPLRARRALVAAQLAVSLVLLVVGSLLLRGLERARQIDLGFDPSGVVAFEFNPELAGRSAEAARAAVAEMVERARALPGVEMATAAAVLPLDLSRMGLGGVEVDGLTAPSEWGFEADANLVMPGFFSTLGIPLAGRDFTASDGPDSERIAIVNRRFERDYLPAGALGHIFYLKLGRDGERTAYRVVGVADDFRGHSLASPPVPFFWLPASQREARAMNLLVRSSEPTLAIATAVQSLFRAVDPDLPPSLPRPLVEVAEISTLPQRLAASVAGGVGTLGVALAALGLYGVLAYSVASRRREIALRMALGAERGAVLRLVAGDVARPLAAGLLFGAGGGGAAAFALRSLLFGLPALDPVSFLGAGALLLAVAALACWAPARRALALDPAAALRTD